MTTCLRSGLEPCFVWYVFDPPSGVPALSSLSSSKKTKLLSFCGKVQTSFCRTCSTAKYFSTVHIVSLHHGPYKFQGRVSGFLACSCPTITCKKRLQLTICWFSFYYSFQCFLLVLQFLIVLGLLLRKGKNGGLG